MTKNKKTKVKVYVSGESLAEVAAGCRLIQVGFMRRYDAAYMALKETVTGGAIGAPLMFHSVHRNATVPKDRYTFEMAVTDTMVHDIDVARWLLDDEAVTVELVQRPALYDA